MLCFNLFASPAREWETLFLILAGSIGSLLAYLYQKRSSFALSLQKLTMVGSFAGMISGVSYVVCSAIIVLLIGNIDILLDLRSIMFALIAVNQLMVAGGIGALIAALVFRLPLQASARQRQ